MQQLEDELEVLGRLHQLVEVIVAQAALCLHGHHAACPHLSSLMVLATMGYEWVYIGPFGCKGRHLAKPHRIQGHLPRLQFKLLAEYKLRRLCPLPRVIQESCVAV